MNLRRPPRVVTAAFASALLLLLMVCSCTTVATHESTPSDSLPGARRIVFFGDSITQGGDYVADVECWLVAHGLQVEVLNLGLGSETATDLTTEENAGHLKKYGFGRPFVSERLARALAATKPDWVFACYGMNDGGSLPPDAAGTKRFAEAVTRLRDAALQAGVRRVVLCTPPMHDAKGDAAQLFHDENLARYSAWLVGKRVDSWEVVDIHGPFHAALDERRAHDPVFRFANDGVHPGREGHWVMAREILRQAFGAKLDGVAAAEDLFPVRGAEIRALVRERMVLRFNAWMTQIGHQRPGAPGGPGAKPGPTVAEATAKAAELTQKIQRLVADSRR